MRNVQMTTESGESVKVEVPVYAEPMTLYIPTPLTCFYLRNTTNLRFMLHDSIAGISVWSNVLLKLGAYEYLNPIQLVAACAIMDEIGLLDNLQQKEYAEITSASAELCKRIDEAIQDGELEYGQVSAFRFVLAKYSDIHVHAGDVALFRPCDVAAPQYTDVVGAYLPITAHEYSFILELEVDLEDVFCHLRALPALKVLSISSHAFSVC